MAGGIPPSPRTVPPKVFVHRRPPRIVEEGSPLLGRGDELVVQAQERGTHSSEAVGITNTAQRSRNWRDAGDSRCWFNARTTGRLWHPAGVRDVRGTGSGGVADAQPPANGWQPSGLAWGSRPQVQRHALERAHRAEGLCDGGKLEEEVRHELQLALCSSRNPNRGNASTNLLHLRRRKYVGFDAIADKTTDLRIRLRIAP
jgi:hypothetical protein